LASTAELFLLEAAVQIADLDVEIDDRLAVELDQELHGAVGRRVRRPHVEDLVLGVEVALEVVVRDERRAPEVGTRHRQFLGPTRGWRLSFG
jgi:hypothetical protein